MDKEIIEIKKHFDEGGYNISPSAHQAIGRLLKYIDVHAPKPWTHFVDEKGMWREYKDQGQ